MATTDRPIEAIAFDLDGLMFNTEDLYVDVAAELLRRRGHELDMRLIHQMMGRPAKTGLPMMIDWYELTDDVESLEQETQDIFEGLLPELLAPLPGLLDLLQRVDALRIPKAIATSSRRTYLERVLHIAQLPTQFDFFLTAEDVQQGKPHPEIYLRAAARFGVEPPAMLVLEDSEHGCRAAVAAGARTIAVPGALNANTIYPERAERAGRLNDPCVLNLLPSSVR